MTSRPDNHEQKKFTPVRPLLNQPPLNIENLPSRIQRGECNVLPPRFCPPMTLPPMVCPPTACQPPPCSPYCMQPSCYPCSPCTPQPPPMCCPPPIQPIIVCPPSCGTPVQQCPPCMPSPPPPPCCPLPPCPPPPCQPCVPSSGCCGGGGGGTTSCCCGPKKHIICVPRRAQQQQSNNQGGHSACSGKKAPPESSSLKPGFGDQPASYNNCNFYLTEVPKSLRNSFGPSSGRKTGVEPQEECIEEEEKRAGEDGECDEEEYDKECDEITNFAAGDGQVVHPPVGYPGSKRSPWGAGYPGLVDDEYGMAGPFEMNGQRSGGKSRGRGSRDDKRGSYDSRGGGGSSGGSKNTGKYAGNRQNTGRQVSNGRGKSGGDSSQHGRADHYNGRSQQRQQIGHGEGQHQGGDTGTGSRNGGRGDQYGRSVHTSRYHRHPVEEENDEDYDDGEYANGREQGSDTAGGRRFIDTSAKTHLNEEGQLSTNKMIKSGTTSRFFSATSGYRPYSYSNAELTQKSEAYLPEKYTVPTPHELDSKIYAGRAPITPYSRSNYPNDEYEARTLYSNRGKSTFAPSSKSTCKQDFGHMTAQTRSQATMVPSHSTIPKTQHANTSTRRLPSTRTTAVPSKSHVKTVGTMPPSKSRFHNAGIGTAPPSYKTKAVTAAPSSSQYTSAGIGTSRSLVQSDRQTRSLQTNPNTQQTRARSQPTFRKQQNEREDEHYPESSKPPASYKTNKTITTVHPSPSTHNKSGVSHPTKSYHQPFGISKQQSEAISNVTDDNDNYYVTDEDNDNKENRIAATTTKRQGKGDPCHPPKTCLQYHTQRLHRLCSVSKQREKRLSDIHKPVLHFKTPPCPIRETNASILRKRPPAKCHEEKIPAFHEYCMTDRVPDTNRYPLLTREFSPLRHEVENQNAGRNQNAPAQRQIEARGAKRKNYHR